MENDDERARNPGINAPRPAIGADLEAISIAALEVYIADLQQEIERVRAVITGKRAARLSAHDIFKR